MSANSSSSSYQHGLQKEKLHQSITRIQCLVRKHQSRNQLKHLYNQHVDEIYDSQYGCFFYYNKKSQTSSWNKLKILSDESLNSSSPQKKRKERRKDEEKKMLRHDELNVVELNNAETVNSHSQILPSEVLQWTTNDVILWFQQIGFCSKNNSNNNGNDDDHNTNTKYKKFIIDTSIIKDYAIDGPLLLNMGKEEWQEIGIVSRIQYRKLEVELKKFGVEYRIEKNKPIIQDDQDYYENGGDYDNMDRSKREKHNQIMHHENNFINNTNNYRLNASFISGECEMFHKTIICPGDANSSNPQNGDIVQIHYSISYSSSTTAATMDMKENTSFESQHHDIICIANTREDKLQKQQQPQIPVPFEFVIGRSGQTIVGFEEAIKSMLQGERAIIRIPPKYAYCMSMQERDDEEDGDRVDEKHHKGDDLGKISSNAFLICDVELISISRPSTTFLISSRTHLNHSVNNNQSITSKKVLFSNNLVSLFSVDRQC